MLFVLIARSRAYTSFPQTYEQLAVTINGSRWDFSYLPVATKSYTAMSLQDQPLLDFLTFHSNVIRCRNADHWCRLISTPCDYEWTVDDLNFQLGLWWTSNGEPNRISADEYEDWEATVEFSCSPTGTSEDPIFRFDTTQRNQKLVLTFADSWGCPVNAATPATPKPGPYRPICRPVVRSSTQADFGISANLNDLNHGRFGYGSLFFANNAIKYVLYQPCERIVPCPWGATCSTSDPTSAWVCDIDLSQTDPVLTTCTAYGTVPSSPTFSLNDPNNLFQGFSYNFSVQDGRSAQVRLYCDESYPTGHIEIDIGRTRLSSDGQTLNLYAIAQEFCPRIIPTPVPNATSCQLDVTQGNYRLRLDLTTYDLVNASVQRTRPFLTSYDLLYKPCGHIVCPAGCDCGGAEDSHIWLCEKWNASVRFCTAYGLSEYNVSLNVRHGYIMRGAEAIYHAHNSRQSVVYWECDNTIVPSMFIVQPTLALSGDTIAFIVKSSEACARGSGPTPTPPGHVFPPKPTPGLTPTPTPIASPIAVHYLSNDTHYIRIDLESAQDVSPWHGVQPFYKQGQFGEIYTVWNSWDRVPCPGGWPCSSDYANLWECWEDEDWMPYCHAVADKHVPGFSVALENSIGGPVILSYPGQWGASMYLRVLCDPESSSNQIRISDSVVIYTNSANGPTWSFNSSSGVACPRPFTNPAAPTDPRSPPSYPIIISTKLNASGFCLSLDQLENTSGHTFVHTTYNSVYKSEIHYSPFDRIGCPDGKECGVYANDEANVWNCVNEESMNCYPIGDKLYNVTMSFVDASDPELGAVVHYEGGAENNSVEFKVRWDHNLSPNNVVIGNTSDETYYMNNVTRVTSIDAWSAGYCLPEPTATPVPAPTPTSSAFSPGAIFLIAAPAVVIGYLLIGILVSYIVNGSLSIPNRTFWSEVGLSLAAAFRFIFHCGERPLPAPMYDKVLSAPGTLAPLTA
jgi:hypothetical protein